MAAQPQSRGKRKAAVEAPPETGSAAVPEALSVRLRQRRQSLGLTLREVATRAGLSVGFISQIERGITLPSLSSLVSVSRVLGMQVGDFLSQPKVTEPMTRHGERPHYQIGTGPVSYERLSSSFAGNKLRSVIVHEPPGHRSEPISHEGEELFFILEGALMVEIEGEKIVMEAGDSIHFPSVRRHSTWNHTHAPVVILHVCTMDIFGEEAAAAADGAAPMPGAATAELVLRRKNKTDRQPSERKSTSNKGDKT